MPKDYIAGIQWKGITNYMFLNISTSHIETRLATTNLVEDIDLISAVFQDMIQVFSKCYTIFAIHWVVTGVHFTPSQISHGS